jgi:hypothetical protein
MSKFGCFSTPPANLFRYDLAAFNDPRIILITDHNGKRSELPRLNYVVLPARCYFPQTLRSPKCSP